MKERVNEWKEVEKEKGNDKAIYQALIYCFYGIGGKNEVRKEQKVHH